MRISRSTVLVHCCEVEAISKTEEPKEEEEETNEGKNWQRIKLFRNWQT